MKIEKTYIEDLFIINQEIFDDNRGYFFESYNYNKFLENKIDIKFIQDNQSFSRYGVIRGLHLQKQPFEQTKLVKVVRGKILDVAVDVRAGSSTFGKYFSIELSDENNKQLLIPKGFAHGFSVLSEDGAIVSYKIDNIYNKDSEVTILYNDLDIGIDWQIKQDKIILSDKDRQGIKLNNFDNN